MRSQGGVALLGILVILAALFCTGFGLTCYKCPKTAFECNSTIICMPNLDACLIAKSERRMYRQCWRYGDCNLGFIKSRLEEKNLLFRCCQEDSCNQQLEEDGSAALSGKIALVVTPLLVAIWNLWF